jgi:hypothetical protein
MRRGISLLEVLISMFVLLFGLMGVAAVFPVGNHFAGKGEQYDRGAALADQAFADIKARGMLNPGVWLYPREMTASEGGLLIPAESHRVMQHAASPAAGSFAVMVGTGSGPGHAFVIDPLGTAEGRTTGVAPYTGLDVFPFGMTTNPWNSVAAPAIKLPGELWPVRRITLPSNNASIPWMTPQVAETICRLRDDLANETPEQDDRPGSQRWSMQIVGAPDKPDSLVPGDDIPLARAFTGSYSWIATVVPTGPVGATAFPHAAFQPATADYHSALFDVSVAVFHKRTETPSIDSERNLAAEFLGDGELVIYADTAEVVDKAADGILPSQWILIAGTQQSGKFHLKWYKIQYIDDETIDVVVTAGTKFGRQVTLDGQAWPIDRNPAGNELPRDNLRAILLPGVIGVSTQSLTME